MIDLFYILRTLVYIQSFLWLYLLDYDHEVNNYFVRVLFPISLGIVYLMFDITGFKFSQYTNPLLKYYTALLLISYVILRYKYSFKNSVCLAFLIVFINSYYWESVLHFNAIIFYGISFNQIVQMFHIIPAYFLVKKLEFNDRSKSIKLFIYGIIVSNLNLVSLNVFPSEINIFGFIINRTFVNNVTRSICLFLLLSILMFYSKLRKKEGGKVTPFLYSTPN